MGGAGLVVCKFDFQVSHSSLYLLGKCRLIFPKRCPDQPSLPRSDIPLSERDDITMRRVKFKKTRKQEQGNAVASSSRTGLSKSRGESVSSRASADVIEISDDEDEYEDEDEEDQEDLLWVLSFPVLFLRPLIHPTFIVLPLIKLSGNSRLYNKNW